MSAANKRENLLPLIEKQSEIFESLVQLNKFTLDLLSQYTAVDEYEHMLDRIQKGDDVIIE